MNSSNIHSIMASPKAQFLIGPNKNEFSIHSELIAAQSSSLANIIRQQKGRFDGTPILWKHVDVDTFICFSAFAFTGDYDGVEPRLRQIPAMVAQPPLLRKTIKLRLTNHRRTPMGVYNSFCWERFKERYSGHEFSPDNVVDTRTHTCADVFLCHARVFIFADRYKIAKLRDLALRKLWIAMVNITFTSNVIPDITQLVKYVYNHTTSKNSAGKEIRALVRRYCIIRLERMCDHAEFRDFAENSELLNAIN